MGICTNEYTWNGPKSVYNIWKRKERNVFHEITGLIYVIIRAKSMFMAVGSAFGGFCLIMSLSCLFWGYVLAGHGSIQPCNDAILLWMVEFCNDECPMATMGRQMAAFPAHIMACFVEPYQFRISPKLFRDGFRCLLANVCIACIVRFVPWYSTSYSSH